MTTTKTTKTPKTPKVKTETKTVKPGLRKPQIRILQSLKNGKPLSRTQISEKAKVDQAGCVEYIGSPNDEVRKANDEKHFPSLITLGMVKQQVNEDGPVTYTITSKGTTELSK